MGKNKTTENTGSVSAFIDAIAHETKRADSLQLVQLMQEQTGYAAKMWGTAIIGFGAYHYKYDSGHEGDAPMIGFSPRANAITIYLAQDFERREELLQKLGKHNTGKACLYIKKLNDVDVAVLKEVINSSTSYMKSKYPLA